MLRLKQTIFHRNRDISHKIILLGLPVIASNLSRTFMNLADMAMVGRLGASALAATGMGAMLTWIVLNFGMSFRTATQTVTSRRLGQKRYNECGTALRNGHILAAIFGIPISLLGYFFADRLVPLFLDDPKVIAMCIDYASIAFLSTFFTTLGFAFQGFYTGIERTRIHMNVSVIANILNVYLNAGLIYGRDGIQSGLSSVSGMDFSWFGALWSWYPFPAMGVKGAAMATLIASLWMAIHYSLYLLTPAIQKKYKVFSLHLSKAMMKRQVLLALPQGSQGMLVVLGYALFYKILAKIGVVELASTEVVFTILHTSFMPAAGIGQACATLVGKYLGEKEPKKAEISIVESVRWSMMIMGTLGILFITIPQYILPIFTNDPDVIRIGSVALRIAGFVQFADAVGMTLWFSLSGAGNTFFPAAVESAIIWLFFLPFSYITGIVLGWGFIGPWIGMATYLFLFASIMLWKILKGDWKEIEV
ncbi:MATE family efflux transporter [Candidatus Neomarinimicrobiota bacterium]